MDWQGKETLGRRVQPRLLLHVFANERVVDANGPELVLDDGDDHAVVTLQDMVHKGGLAGTQEAGDDLRVRFRVES